MYKSVMRKYARLTVRMGVNLQKKQGLIVVAETDQAEFALMVADEAYKAGAKWVDIRWSNESLQKLKYRHESLKVLSETKAWEKARLQDQVDEMPARLLIESSDPDGLRGVNIEKMQKAAVARMAVQKPYRDALEGKQQWCIAAVPSVKWAKKVFPGLRASQAVEKLWEAILKAVRVSAGNDPILEWQAHSDALEARGKKLAARNFKTLHYYNVNGTDFRCDLIPGSKWEGGGARLKDGTFFVPNMPTEELFTTPKKGTAEGTLVATLPLSFQGNLIENFSITFRDGKVIEVHAEKGQALLEKIVSIDEGASMLGELALIPSDSPISNLGILFYNTLFDENAACHAALGRGFNETVPGFENMTKEELDAAGVNDSLIHVDFMIGDANMNIDGITESGEVVPVFRNGGWTGEFL